MYHGHSGNSFEGSFPPGGAPSHSHSTPKSKGPIKRSVVVSKDINNVFNLILCALIILHFGNRLKYIPKSSQTSR